MNQTPTGTTLYEKHKNKYVPVMEYFSTDYYREGAYLVIISPGRRSMAYKKYLTEGDLAKFECALKILSDKLGEKIGQLASTPRIPKELTEEQQKAFDVWREAFKTNMVYFPSMAEVVDELMQELRKLMKF